MADSHKLAVVTPETGVDGQPVYANVAQVSFTPFDFRITFSLLSTPHSEQVSDPLAPTFAPQAVAEVVMPAAAIESLADALRAELNDYVDRFGAPAASPAAGERVGVTPSAVRPRPALRGPPCVARTLWTPGDQNGRDRSKE